MKTDASNKWINIVLTQKRKSLAYFTKALGNKGHAMSTYEKLQSSNGLRT